MNKKSVFNEIGFTPEEAEILQLKSQILIKIDDLVKAHNLSRRDLEKILDVPQPRVSELMSGRINAMRVDSLLNHLFKLAKHLKISVKIDIAA